MDQIPNDYRNMRSLCAFVYFNNSAKTYGTTYFIHLDNRIKEPQPHDPAGVMEERHVSQFRHSIISSMENKE